MTDAKGFIAEVRRRVGNFKSVWDDVEDALRDDFEEQLEQSKGPDGKKYKPLKSSTLKKPRRSSKPYDTDAHTTWDEFVGGGRVTKTKNSLKIEIDTDGAKYSAKERPVGTSDKAADEIADIVADYIVED